MTTTIPERRTPDRDDPRRALRPRRRPRALTTAAVLAAVAVSALPSAAHADLPRDPVGARTTKGVPVPVPVDDQELPVPARPSGLPAALEAPAPYVAQVSCEPQAKPGTVAFATLLTTTYPGTSTRTSGVCGQESVASEHADGRAVDWLVSARSAPASARAEAFLGWLLATDSAGRAYANARRTGVMYVLWNDRIWRAWNGVNGWAPYSTCATHPEKSYDAVCHRDHMQISLSWAGARGRTSWWSRSVAAHDYGPCRAAGLNWAAPRTTANTVPCPARPAETAPAGSSALLTTLTRFSGATVGPGDAGPIVSAVQQALAVSPDGQYGGRTTQAVTAFQTRHGITATGSMDGPTWLALLTAARTAVSPTPPPAGNALKPYARTVLQYGSRGPAVLALQRRLGTSVSGWFGPATKAAVIAFQKAHKLPATGVVNAATWKALGA